MPRVVLIGAGALGKYHLVGLLRAPLPLSITVVDPSSASLAIAKKTAAEEGTGAHDVSYVETMPVSGSADLAIVATTAADRADAIRTLLQNVKELRYAILEKILFDKKEQYESIADLLRKRNVSAFVNHARRLFPFHRALKEHVSSPLRFQVSGGARYGLMTSVLHYVDYMCYLTGEEITVADTSLLSREIVPSKRSGFIELFGTLAFSLSGGSSGTVSSLPQEGGIRLSLDSADAKAELFESEEKAALSRKENNWQWEEHACPMLRQSDLSGAVAAKLLSEGKCDLTPYEESARTHRAVLEPVRLFLMGLGHPYEHYPFT